MSSQITLITPTPLQSSFDEGSSPVPIVKRREPFLESKNAPRIIWIVAIIIVILIIVLAAFLILRQQSSVLELPYQEDTPLLDNLIDLTANGQCCIPANATTPTPRWIYLPSADFTYSINPLDPEIVCSNLTGLDNLACVRSLSDANGNVKIVANRGITPYYGFFPGQPSSVCSSFVGCPL